MKLRKVNVGQLKPAPYNPRVTLKPGMPGYEKLAKSLREFSLVQPLVWNEQTGHIVGGHQRLTILKAEGVQEIDVVVVSLSLEREKSLNIALNNERIGSKWDTEKLGNLLGELAELPDVDLSLTGFNETDLRDLLLEPAEIDLDEEQGESTTMQITLEIDPQDWPEIRKEIDHLMQTYDFQVHS